MPMCPELRKHVLALDEGTTSARAILFDYLGKIEGIGQHEFPQIYPRPGWVEHSPDEIWESQLRSIKDCLNRAGAELGDVAAIGVTNQRETTILWDKRSGKPVYNAIVWQCRRTSDIVDWLKKEHGGLIREKTGLVPDSYFSAPKVKWLLDNIPSLREKAARGDILFGTVDTFLIWRLTGGKVHVTDYSNASRTMMFNIYRLEWDDEILELLRIPEEMLPEVRPSSEIYGFTSEKALGKEIPIGGDAGDQQAALFGQAAFSEGETKCTYGTGNFILMNTSSRKVRSKSLLTTIAWSLEERRSTYALEGSIFITGAAVQWLRDSLQIIRKSGEVETLAKGLGDNEGVYFVPAFVGLGAPYWDQYARGLIIGITRGTGRAHLARSVLESIAYLTRDVIEIMEEDSGIKISEVKVDGGAARNNFLMQFQADILGKRIVRPSVLETTALGAAYLAGLSTGYWSSLDEIRKLWKVERVFEPSMTPERREKLYSAWRKAVSRSLGWARILKDLGFE